MLRFPLPCGTFSLPRRARDGLAHDVEVDYEAVEEEEQPEAEAAADGEEEGKAGGEDGDEEDEDLETMKKRLAEMEAEVRRGRCREAVVGGMRAGAHSFFGRSLGGPRQQAAPAWLG